MTLQARSSGAITLRVAACVIVTMLSAPSCALAASLDGAAMGWPWALPFFGILLSIATGPLLFRGVWHRHYGKIAFGWGLVTLAALAAVYGAPAALAALVHALVAEYVSFIVLLFALYTVAGGILVTGTLRGSPLVNSVMLAIGAVMASLVGTTGAAMILIRPLLRANAARLHNVHVVVFFIILVGNVGGALSPLGDPPLFVGFLRGVDFFWTTRHLYAETIFTAGLLLLIFTVLDVWLARKDRRVAVVGEPVSPTRIEIHGQINLLLICGIIAAILGSGLWKPGVAVDLYGTRVELQNALRDAALIALAGLSLWLTPDEHREANGFTWEPIAEVAKLFAAIFVCIIPVLAMLQAGDKGSFAWLSTAVTTPTGAPNIVAYFWLTGLLSAFLDNAPTYLVFFELAGGDAGKLMTEDAAVLAAISLGAVFMGALTYIGNAPNFMIYAIAEERGIKMPSFFGYLGWASLVLLPVFALVTAILVFKS